MANFYSRVVPLQKPFTEVRLAESEIDQEAMWTKYSERLSATMRRDRWTHAPKDFIYFLRAISDRFRRRILEGMPIELKPLTSPLVHTHTSPLTASIASMVPGFFGLEVPVERNYSVPLSMATSKLPFSKSRFLTSISSPDRLTGGRHPGWRSGAYTSSLRDGRSLWPYY